MYRLRGKDWKGRTCWVELVLGGITPLICITYTPKLAYVGDDSWTKTGLQEIWKQAKTEYPNYKFERESQWSGF